jgi:hypothetical protein
VRYNIKIHVLTFGYGNLGTSEGSASTKKAGIVYLLKDFGILTVENNK